MAATFLRLQLVQLSKQIGVCGMFTVSVACHNSAIRYAVKSWYGLETKSRIVLLAFEAHQAPSAGHLSMEACPALLNPIVSGKYTQ